MTSDELEIYRLKMMGATQEQLDSVTATQQATQAFRKQGSAAAGTAKGGLRLMRGGLGQVRSSGPGYCGPASNGSERNAYSLVSRVLRLHPCLVKMVL